MNVRSPVIDCLEDERVDETVGSRCGGDLCFPVGDDDRIRRHETPGRRGLLVGKSAGERAGARGASREREPVGRDEPGSGDQVGDELRDAIDGRAAGESRRGGLLGGACCANGACAR